MFFPWYIVAILYSSSQNSLIVIAAALYFGGHFMSQSFIHQVRILSPSFISGRSWSFSFSRNPLFIKSEFSRNDQLAGYLWRRERDVAILYSSSQNSLLLKADEVATMLGVSQSFIHQVRILSCLRRWKLNRQAGKNWQVAILYSSSQNSLRDCPSTGIGKSSLTCRNPLFIKSEFSRHLRNPLPCMG